MHNVSRITVIIALPNCLVINENISNSINEFVIFACMFATRLVAFRFIISNSNPDEMLTKIGRLSGSVFWRLNKDTSNLSIIFENAVIRLNALNEIINVRTECIDLANIYVLLFGRVGK